MRCMWGKSKHPQKFFPVGAGAGHLFAEYPGAPGRLQLPKLGIEGLAVGADAGIADQAGNKVFFGHILYKV